MDKKKLGALVGVIGVASTFAAAQFIDLDQSNADYVTKDLVKKHEDYLAEEESSKEESLPVIENTVFDQAQKVEYVLKTPAPIEEPKEESAKQESALEIVEEKPEEEPVKIEPIPEPIVEAPKIAEVVAEEITIPEPIKEEEPVEVSAETSENAEVIPPAVREEEWEVPVEEVPVEEEVYKGIVNTGTLFVREKAEASATIVDYLEFGDVVRGTIDNGWIKLEEGKYLSSEFVVPATEEELVVQEAYLAELRAAAEAQKTPKEETEDSAETVEAVQQEAVTLWTSTGLNVRSEASDSADILRVLSRGTEVSGYVEGSWLRLSDGTGFVAHMFLTDEKPVEEEPVIEELIQEEPVVLYTGSGLNLRSEASATSEILGVLSKGTEVSGYKEGSWLRLSDGSGFVAYDFLTTERPVVSRSGYAQYAVNVRAENSDVSDILGVLAVNDYVEGVEKGAWLEFTYNGQTAYVNKNFIGAEKVEIPEEVVEAAASGYVNTAANIRSGAGTDYDVLATLGVNTYVEGTQVGDWVKFDYEGSTAYIYGTLLSSEKQEVEEPVVEEDTDTTAVAGSSAQAVADAVAGKVGLPYIFAASGPNAFDCSGLTMWAYANYAGVSLPHSAMAQSGYGYSVSRDNLQPGDLLFFTTDGTGEVSHVGVYVGGGQMVHAASPGYGVRYDDIWSSYYNSTFVTARRIIQ